MSTWTDEQEKDYQETTKRARELEAQRSEVLTAREKGVEQVTVKLFKDAGFKSDSTFAMRTNAAAVRAALAPYDGSNTA